jgi:flagellin-like protein
MRRFRADGRALAEVVGTLLLVVIVIAAVTAFSFFIAAYQSQVQNEEQYAHNQALESVHVYTLLVTATAAPSKLIGAINFTMTSADVNSITVNNIEINGNPLAYYNVTPYQFGQPGTTLGISTASSNYILGPRAEAQVEVNVSTTCAASPTTPSPVCSSFYDRAVQLDAGTYIEVSILTSYQNDFVSSFTAPSAVVQIETQQLGSTETTILDGTHSYQPENGTLESWSWNVTLPTDDSCYSVGTPYFTSTSAIVQTTCPMTSDGTYVIHLTVVNSYGLFGTATLDYTPEPPAAPTALAAATGGAGAVDLTWTNPIGLLTGDTIYYSTAMSGPFTALPANGVSSAPGGVVTATTVSGLIATDTYYFEVSASDAAGQGPVSNVASAVAG